jgi:hypothetical protein
MEMAVTSYVWVGLVWACIKVSDCVAMVTGIRHMCFTNWGKCSRNPR